MKNLRDNLNLLTLAMIISCIISSCDNQGKYTEVIKLIPVKIGDEYQYIDVEGKTVINPQFSYATIFRNGLALVETQGSKQNFGYIGEDGKFAISAKYLRATMFNEDLAWIVSENTAPSCINTLGEIQFTLKNAQEVRNFTEGLAAFKETNDGGEERWGFVDKNGIVKINSQFSNVGGFCDGLCSVSNPEGKWGYIDKEGKLLINYQFEKAQEFINGFAIVKSGDKEGIIDEKGKYSVNPQFLIRVC